MSAPRIIAPIQYLRGIAAMMVVWHHATGQVPGIQAYVGVSEFGAKGVDLFFTVSGFIMLVTTWEKPITPSQFMLKRIARIVPLYWATTLAMVAVATLVPTLFKSLQWNGTALIKSLLFIPYESLSTPGTIFPILSPGWTLDFEMFFYVLFAASLWLPKKFRVGAVVGLLGVLIVLGDVLTDKGPLLNTYTNYHVLEFAFGMIAGLVYSGFRSDGMHRSGHQSWLGEFLPKGSSKLLLALGDASYSIYLTHLFTLGALRVVWVKLIPRASMTSSISLMAVSLVASAFAGWLCYLFIERRLTNWFSHRSTRPGSGQSRQDRALKGVRIHDAQGMGD